MMGTQGAQLPPLRSFSFEHVGDIPHVEHLEQTSQPPPNRFLSQPRP